MGGTFRKGFLRGDGLLLYAGKRLTLKISPGTKFRIGDVHLARADRELRDGPQGPALRLSLKAARQAVRRGDQQLAFRASALLNRWDLENLRFSRSLEELMAHDALRAVQREAWQEALSYVDAILALGSADAAKRGRALANRATALTTLGRFEAAVRAYDALEGDEAAWQEMPAEYQSGFILSQASAAWYLGPVSLSSVASTPPHITKVPMTWMNYWWLLGHIALKDFPHRLLPIREASRRTFDWEWPAELDRALWGLDLLAARAPADRRFLERRIEMALADPATWDAIGRAGWHSLYGDWLTYRLRTDPARGLFELEAHQRWCRSHGYDGWAGYWASAASQLTTLPADAGKRPGIRSRTRDTDGDASQS